MTAVPAEFRDRVKASLDKLMPKARVETEAILAHPGKLAALYAEHQAHEAAMVAARKPKPASPIAVRPAPAAPIAPVAQSPAPPVARQAAAAPMLLDRKQQARAAEAYALEHKCDFTEACRRLGFGVVGVARSSPQWSPPTPARGTPQQQATEAGAYAAKHGVGFVEACKALEVDTSCSSGVARFNYDSKQLQRRHGPGRIAA